MLGGGTEIDVLGTYRTSGLRGVSFSSSSPTAKYDSVEFLSLDIWSTPREFPVGSLCDVKDQVKKTETRRPW